MALKLPRISNLIYSKKGNEIWQYFGAESVLENFTITNSNPFIIKADGVDYLLTSDKEWVDNNSASHVLLTTKKPTKRDLEESNIDIKRWLKHSLFLNLSPNEVRLTWTDKFRFINEDETKNIKGLRPPQIGALYSILAHVQNSEDRAIVIMPTGTGKTETMLSTLVANQCQKLLVTVPSDSLRTQISDKFNNSLDSFLLWG